MLRILVREDKEGCLAEIKAEGHAGFGARGADIVCSAASVLLRSSARALEEIPSLIMEGEAKQSGDFYLALKSRPAEAVPHIRGISHMTVRGLQDLADEYPDWITVRIERKEDDSYGT